MGSPFHLINFPQRALTGVGLLCSFLAPGDQLKITAKLDKVRGNKLATANVECQVGEKVVSSASLMFSIVDAGEGA